MMLALIERSMQASEMKYELWPLLTFRLKQPEILISQKTG